MVLYMQAEGHTLVMGGGRGGQGPPVHHAQFVVRKQDAQGDVIAAHCSVQQPSQGRSVVVGCARLAVVGGEGEARGEGRAHGTAAAGLELRGGG